MDNHFRLDRSSNKLGARLQWHFRLAHNVCSQLGLLSLIRYCSQTLFGFQNSLPTLASDTRGRHLQKKRTSIECHPCHISYASHRFCNTSCPYSLSMISALWAGQANCRSTWLRHLHLPFLFPIKMPFIVNLKSMMLLPWSKVFF